jgi:signal transduction histidine kinase
VSVETDEHLPRASVEVEDALLRIYLEALKNISKHARARSVHVQLYGHAGRIGLRISDDGVGFDTSRPARRNQDSGWGLMIMRERAEAAGAELRVESASGQGTRVEFAVAEQRWR